MDSAPTRTGVGEQCPERERLLREWTQCGRRLINLLDEHLAALKQGDQKSIDFDEEISIAKAQRMRRASPITIHVDSHDCV